MKQLFIFAFFLCAVLSCKKSDTADQNQATLNQPPSVPANPFPADNDSTYGTEVTLHWAHCTDPQGDDVTYDVIVDHDSNFSVPYVYSVSGITSVTCNVDGLTSGAHYFWKVKAKDSHGNVSEGPVWQFYCKQGVVIVVDGYYVTGGATGYADLNSKCLMHSTLNEVNQSERPQLLELFIPVKAGAEGFNIVLVAGTARKTFGPGSSWTTITSGTVDEPKVPFQRGDVIETTTHFTVPADGMYHVVYDTELKKGTVCPVHWGIIGAATPLGWGMTTQFTESAFDLNTITWSISDLILNNGDWKLRYSNGWKIDLDTTINVGYGQKGVKVNTNMGGDPENLVPGGWNIINTNPGRYDMFLNYTLGTGYHLTMTRTGNLPPVDYSDYQMGIIGNAYLLAPGDTANWNVNFGTSLPNVNGTVYIWNYTLDLIADRQFKFRQGDDWNGKSIGFADVTMAGPAAANFADSGADHNFKVIAGGNYTLVLRIDANTEQYTLTATKN